MKKEDLPEFAKPYKTKGYDVRLVRGAYQLFKISSKRVPEKSYPVLIQEYVGTIDPEKGLIPKKITTNKASAFVEYGLSHFILSRYKSELLQACNFDNSESIQSVYMGIVKFMYGHTQQRFIDLSYLQTMIKPCPELKGSSSAKRVAKVASKIASLLKEDIPDTADRDYVIAALKDIKADPSLEKPAIAYSDELTALLDKYGIDTRLIINNSKILAAHLRQVSMTIYPLKEPIKVDRKHVDTLLHFFDDVKDYRQANTQEYNLDNIFCICLLLAMKGELTSFSYAAEYIQIKDDYFQKLNLIEGKNYPSYDTLNRIFQHIDSQELKDKLLKSIDRLIRKITGTFGSEQEQQNRLECDDSKPLNKSGCQVNIFDSSSLLRLVSEALDGNKPEISAFEQMLKRYKLKNTMITADALHCQLETCHIIVDKGGLYIFEVDSNHAALKEHMTCVIDQNQDKCITKTFNNCDYEIFILDYKATEQELPETKAFVRMVSHKRKDLKDYNPEQKYFISSANNAQL
ncbi:ISAs1 family transposase, partial [Anaerobiospirillum succiniciproducens]|uniref:ISAs1 family transposase n=1 Tax=Anaerobiospirillum succiniciproducens TaxID=13335 RepID=UPI0005C75D47